MILSVQYEVLNSIELKVIYDDNSFKKVVIGCNDIVQIAYNKNGMRKDVKGRIANIETDHCHDHRHPNYVYRGCNPYVHVKDACFIVLDCSDTGISDIEKINVKDIIDCELIQRYNDNHEVMSPNGADRITNIRLHEGVLQISKDFGASWIDIKDVLGIEVGATDTPTTEPSTPTIDEDTV